MKRLFVGIKITPTEELTNLFEELQQSLKGEKIRWANNDRIHITLKFFGKIEEDKIPSINNVLMKSAGKSSRFSINLSGLGVFPDSRSPTVLWAGIEKQSLLFDLYNNIKRELKIIGYEPENRSFEPHLTLGRFRYMNNNDLLRDIVSEYNGIQIQKQNVEQFNLYESILRPQSPLYKIVETYYLQK